MIHLNPLSEYGWNELAGRYVDLTTGRFIAFDVIKSELEAVVSASQANIVRISEQLIAGDITLPQWQLLMEKEIKIGNVASAALAKGGWAQMTQADWGYVGSNIKKQYQYLRNFAQEIASGKCPLNGRLITRARLYGAEDRAMFEEMRRRYMRLNKGATEERRVLLPGAEHCEPHESTPGCTELAAKGWQPVGTLPPIGAATCRTFCRCVFEFKDAEGKVI
jgi:hypothetical protein